MSQEKDKVFFRNFSLVVGLLAVLMIIFLVAARVVGIDEKAEAEQRAASVAKATAPMGESSVAGDEEEAPTVSAPATPAEASSSSTTATEVADTGNSEDSGNLGKKVFEGLCISCHGMGPAMAAMIPQFGDKKAWAPRIAQGKDTLYQHALNGFSSGGGMAMPPRGGGDLSDDEVKAAVDYMVANSM